MVSVDGSMVGVDLGTRIVGVPLDPAARASAANAAKDACTATWKSTCRTDDFANAIIQHDASFSGPEGTQYGQYVWEPTTVGKIDFLEMFNGSAKLGQSASTIC